MTSRQLCPRPSRRRETALLFSLLGGVLLAAGCSGGNGNGSNSGTGPETFNVTVNLTVQGAGNGNGQVSGSQISCQIQGGQAAASGCQGSVTISSSSLPTTVTLTASAAQGSTFVTWGGACASSAASATCQLSVNSSTRTWNFSSTAQFDLLPGSIQVTTVTSGSDQDDGYTLAIDQADKGALGANAVSTYSGLAPGNHTVTLGGVAANCTVAGDNPRTVAVTAGGTAQTTFDVTCAATTGTIQVTTVTNGNAQDLDDEYTVAIGQAAPVAMGVNATQTFSQLAPGNHTVTLGDIASNCTLDEGENPRAVAVTVGQTTPTTFTLTCAPPPGSIEVTTSTTGQTLPGDDYVLFVDQAVASSIGINATVDLGSYAPGNYEVSLASVPVNCTVGGENPRTLTVAPESKTQTTFNVSCQAIDYVAFERVSEWGDKDICLLDPNVGEASVNCITKAQGPGGADDVHPAWGPNQAWLIFASNRDGDFEIYTMKPDGSDVTKLTDNTVFDGDPDVYFSGTKAVFTSERSGNKDIWEMDLTQGTHPVTQLTFDPASDFNPTYLWDSGYRAFTSNRDGNQDIWRVDPWGTVGQQTISDDHDDDAWYMPPNLYYSSDRYGTWDVIRAPNGLPVEQFFASQGSDIQPAPAADGLWVAFATNQDGNYEIYKRNRTTGEVVRLTNNGTSDTRPAWYSWRN